MIGQGVEDTELGTVVRSRTVSELLARARPAPHPDWIEPMAATLTDRRFSDPAWVFERKLDGVRVLGFRLGESVRLLSRRRQKLERTYPELVVALGAQEEQDFVVDGEVVAFDDGRTSFSLLQSRLGVSDPERARQSGIEVFYYVFDLLHLEGHDTRALPLLYRKELLQRSLDLSDPLRFTDHRAEAGEAYLQEACAQGWEGLIAKRADSSYVSRRSQSWLKMKCSSAQEFVVGGFTDPGGSRVGLGALLLGYYEDGQLRYAGKVGTGYTHDVLVDLRRRLDALEVDRSPFAEPLRPPERGAHWVRPELVAEVAFTEWTGDGKLRHPSFEGLRTDKVASEVVRELPRRHGGAGDCRSRRSAGRDPGRG